MIDYQVFDSKEKLLEEGPKMLTRISAFWNFDSGPLQLTYSKWTKPRTRSQNSLYWEWLNQMAEHFSTRDNHFSKEDMHDLMRHKFLGYEDKKLGSTEIKNQLKTTTRLNTAVMAEYMNKIEAWAVDHGCLLPIPDHNEYQRYREARQ